jgi:integrase
MLPETTKEAANMAYARLNKTSIEEVQPSTKDVVVWDTELRGFGLKVTPKGNRSFFLYYRTHDHKQRRPKLGTYPATKPDQARKMALEWLAKVQGGADPSSERKAKRAARGDGSLRDLFDLYKADKTREGLRTVSEIERTFNHDILPVLGRAKADQITSGEVTKLLDNVAKRSPSVAWAVRRQLSAFYTWAIPRLPEGANNPVRNASRPPKVKARERVLTNDELKTLWAVLNDEVEPWRTALRLLILTGQRREEVLSAQWSEFDLAKKVWTIPAERAKNGKAHVVPLSAPVLALLKTLPGGKGPLFPVGTGVASRAAKRIRDAMGAAQPWHWHDIRRTMATGLQRLGVRLEVTEAILNHVSGSRAGIVGVYQRHDWASEKRDALNNWAREVDRIVTERPKRSKKA